MYTYPTFIYKHFIMKSFICHLQAISIQMNTNKNVLITFSMSVFESNRMNATPMKNVVFWIEKELLPLFSKIHIAYSICSGFGLKSFDHWPFNIGFSRFPLQILYVLYSKFVGVVCSCRTMYSLFWPIYFVVPKTDMFTWDSIPDSRLFFFDFSLFPFSEGI